MLTSNQQLSLKSLLPPFIARHDSTWAIPLVSWGQLSQLHPLLAPCSLRDPRDGRPLGCAGSAQTALSTPFCSKT